MLNLISSDFAIQTHSKFLPKQNSKIPQKSTIPELIISRRTFFATNLFARNDIWVFIAPSPLLNS